MTFEEMMGDVGAFLRLFEGTGWSREQVARNRARMAIEEATELGVEVRAPEPDKAAIAHEAIDLVYVAIGALIEAEVSPEQALAVWREVARANAEKRVEPGVWKAIKPEGWRPPQVRAVFAR